MKHNNIYRSNEIDEIMGALSKAQGNHVQHKINQLQINLVPCPMCKQQTCYEWQSLCYLCYRKYYDGTQ